MAQSIGLYQLENLKRAQTKYIMVAITSAPPAETATGIPGDVPVHPFLKHDFVFGKGEAAAKIFAIVEERQMPVWWPIILVSKEGTPDGAIADELAPKGLINVYSYRGGWDALIAESPAT